MIERFCGKKSKATWNGLVLDIKSNTNIIISVNKEPGKIKDNTIYTYEIDDGQNKLYYENTKGIIYNILKIRANKKSTKIETNLKMVDALLAKIK